MHTFGWLSIVHGIWIGIVNEWQIVNEFSDWLNEALVDVIFHMEMMMRIR